MRLISRALLVVAGLLALAAFASLKNWIPRDLLGSILMLLGAVFISTVWAGLRHRHQVLADREKASGGIMIVAIAAQLGRQDDATLERIRAQGGPAGEAASMILTERKNRAARTRE
jgi:hypothetical protein